MNKIAVNKVCSDTLYFILFTFSVYNLVQPGAYNCMVEKTKLKIKCTIQNVEKITMKITMKTVYSNGIH